MKIKAIMLGLVVSGGLLLANGTQRLYDPSTIEQQIDNMSVNPLDPNLTKEIMKALARLDNNTLMNDKNIQTLQADLYIALQTLEVTNQKVKELQKEVAKLKNAKK